MINGISFSELASSTNYFNGINKKTTKSKVRFQEQDNSLSNISFTGNKIVNNRKMLPKISDYFLREMKSLEKYFTRILTKRIIVNEEQQINKYEYWKMKSIMQVPKNKIASCFFGEKEIAKIEQLFDSGHKLSYELCTTKENLVETRYVKGLPRTRFVSGPKGIKRVEYFDINGNKIKE